MLPLISLQNTAMPNPLSPPPHRQPSRPSQTTLSQPLAHRPRALSSPHIHRRRDFGSDLRHRARALGEQLVVGAGEAGAAHLQRDDVGLGERHARHRVPHVLPDQLLHALHGDHVTAAGGERRVSEVETWRGSDRW